MNGWARIRKVFWDPPDYSCLEGQTEIDPPMRGAPWSWLGVVAAALTAWGLLELGIHLYERNLNRDVQELLKQSEIESPP